MKFLTVFSLLYMVALTISLGAMEILAPLLILTSLVTYFIGRNPNKESFQWSMPVGFKPLIALYVITIVGVFWNELPQANATHAIGKMRWILIYFFLHNIFTNIKLSEKAPKALLYLAPLVSLIALFAFTQFWTGFDLLRGDDFKFPIAYRPSFYDVRWRSIGFFNSPLTYGYSFAGLLCLLSAVYFQKFKAKQPLWMTLLMLSSTLVIGLSIITSYSRGVWLALIFGLIVTFFFLQKKLILGFLLTITTAIAIYVPFDSAMKERLTSMADPKYTSNLERIKIWTANIEIFKDSPWVGVGYEYNDMIIADYYKKLKIKDAPASHAHNTYLQFLAGTGIFGLLAFLAFVIQILWASTRLIKYEPSQYLFVGILGMQATILIGGFTECNFKDAEINHLFIYFTALASAAWMARKKELTE